MDSGNTSDVGYPDDNPKTQYGVRKPSLALVPGTAMVSCARVFELGARKYGPYNWRDRTVSSSVYVNAAERHLRAWWDGETTDPESGESHLAHVMACMAILLDAHATQRLNDDRPTPAPTGAMMRDVP